MRPGTIEELSSGRFAARLPRTLDPRRRRIGTYATYEEAESMLDGALAVAQKKTITEPKGETLHSFLPGFLDRRELNGVRNVARDRNAAKNYLETAPFLGTPLLKITRVQINDWLEALQRQKSKKTGGRLAPQTLRNILNLLRVCFEEATNRGLMMQNPARDLRLNRATTNTTEDAWTILEPAEQASFLAAMPAGERRYYQFAIGTGLRPGEQRALLKKDVHVDVDEPFLTARYGSPGKPTKTGKPRRVPLFGAALDAAREQLAALKKLKNPKGIFWPGAKGRYRDEGVPEGWASWLQAAEIARTVRPYDLRHTCASALVSGWLGGRRWTLEEVKEVLGHTDIKTTQRYAHLGETAIRDAVRETREALAVTETKGAGRTGPKLVQNGENRGQGAESIQSEYAFVNRRSGVQVSKSAPQKTCGFRDQRDPRVALRL